VRASVKFHLHKGRPLAKKVPVASSFSTGYKLDFVFGWGF
jgi:hypothetical protein